MRDDELRERYRKIASHYDETVLSDSYVLHEAVAALVVDAFEAMNIEQPRILDLGCGTGLSSRPLFERGYRVVGVDLSPEMLEQARTLPFESLIEQSILDSIDVEGPFDAAVVTGVFELMEDIESVLHNAREHTDMVAMSVPTECAEPERIGIRLHDPSETEQAIRNAGFDITREVTLVGYEKEGVPVIERVCLLRSS